ncbi:MAG: alpha/beta fold hydrolase [Flavobacteriales bacterium]|nr:alpha/beta fold hydrolase [Flavobacteriales bacterium]
MLHPRFALTVLLVLNCCTHQAQETLPRRVFLGIRMENVTDDMRRIMGIGDAHGVLLSEVLPNGSGEAAGWKRGDLLTELDGKLVGTTEEVFTELAKHSTGSTVGYRVLRDKKPVSGKLKLLGWPGESYPDLHVEYTAHRTTNGIQRAILTSPKTKRADKAPLVVFIGGISCYSLDSPLDTARSEIQLLNRLGRMGYACARLEKPGVGDATRTSTPCAELSFMNEMIGYAEMIAQLKQRADIDSGHVTIIGHSMGGLFAPLVAQRTPVHRIVAYGTIGSNFMEYLIKTRRTIGEAYGWGPSARTASSRTIANVPSGISPIT